MARRPTNPRSSFDADPLANATEADMRRIERALMETVDPGNPERRRMTDAEKALAQTYQQTADKAVARLARRYARVRF